MKFYLLPAKIEYEFIVVAAIAKLAVAVSFNMLVEFAEVSSYVKSSVV